MDFGIQLFIAFLPVDFDFAIDCLVAEIGRAEFTWLNVNIEMLVGGGVWVKTQTTNGFDDPNAQILGLFHTTLFNKNDILFWDDIRR